MNKVTDYTVNKNKPFSIKLLLINVSWTGMVSRRRCSVFRCFLDDTVFRIYMLKFRKSIAITPAIYFKYMNLIIQVQYHRQDFETRCMFVKLYHACRESIVFYFWPVLFICQNTMNSIEIHTKPWNYIRGTETQPIL